MPRVRVSTGVTLAYSEQGHGPPLVLIDGFGGRWVWFKNVGPLSRAFRVIALDIRGVGDSDAPPGPYSVPVMARELAEVILALHAAPANLAAMSVGGYVAQELALDRPDLVRKLVLHGTNLGNGWQVPPTTLLAVTQPLPGLPLDQAFRLRLPGVLSPGYIQTHPLEVEELVALVTRSPTTNVGRVGLLQAGALWPGSYGRIQSLRQPALVVNGGQDRLNPLLNSTLLAAAVPGHRLWVFPGAGHLCNIERTQAYNWMLTGFLMLDP